MNRYLLHLGSNLNEPLKQLIEAEKRLEDEGKIVCTSKIYKTEAWGLAGQPDFLNRALHFESMLSPHELLEVIHNIEHAQNRNRKEKWGPRTIDIDILFFNEEIIESEVLTIPHKHIAERNFVLIPLLDIAAEYIHPKNKKTVEELYEQCEDPSEVILL